MRCAHIQERLVLYLAGELRPRENAQLIDHLARCPECAAQAEDLAATQERIGAVLRTDIEAPPTLDARVMASIGALRSRETNGWGFLRARSRRPVFALTAALSSVAIVAIVMGRLYSTRAVDLMSLGTAHDRQVAALLPGNEQASDPRQLGPQLTSQVRFPVRAADLSPEGAQLEGGNQTTVDNVAMATLHYKWNGKQISLFELDGTRRTPVALRKLGHDADSYYVRKVGDLAYVAWHSGKTDCVMVARAVPMHLLFHLACRACERQEQL